MSHIYINLFVLVLIVLLAASVYINTASAQQITSSYVQTEAARWTQEYVTVQLQCSTTCKEATNVKQQSLDECKHSNTHQRNECIANARLEYNQHIADIRLKFKK